MKKFLYLLVAGSMLFSLNAFAETKTASKNDVKILIHVLDQNLKYITRNDKELVVARKRTSPSKEEKALTNMSYYSAFHSNVQVNGAIVDIVPKKSYSTYTLMERSNKGYEESKDYSKQSVSFPQESREVVLLPKGKVALTAKMPVPAPVVARQKKNMLELNMKPFSGAYIKGKTNLKVRYRAIATRSGTSQQTVLTSSSPKVVFAGLRTGLYSFKYRASIIDKRGVELAASAWSPVTKAYAGYPLEAVSIYDHLYEPAIDEMKTTYYWWQGPKTHTYYDGTMSFGNVPEQQIYTAGIHNGNLVDIRYTYEVKRSNKAFTKSAAVGEQIYMHDNEGNGAIVACRQNEVSCNNKGTLSPQTNGGCTIRALISGGYYSGQCYVTPLSNLKRGQYYDYRYRVEFLKNGKVVSATGWSDQGHYYVPHATNTDYSRIGNAGKSLISFRPLDLSSKGEYFLQIDGPSYYYGVAQPARKIQPGDTLAKNIVVTNRDNGKVTQFGSMCDKAAKPLECSKLPLNQLFPAGRYQAKFKSGNTWSPVLDFTLTK